MSNTYRRKRTIAMTECRSHQLALVSAELGITSEDFIQSAITAALITAAEHDDPLAFALARAAGASWEDIQTLVELRAERKAKARLVPTDA